MRWISLLFIGIATFVIVLMIQRPELLKDLWLWLCGFAGLIVHGLQVIWSYLKELFLKAEDSIMGKKKETVSKVTNKKV